MGLILIPVALQRLRQLERIYNHRAVLVAFYVQGKNVSTPVSLDSMEVQFVEEPLVRNFILEKSRRITSTWPFPDRKLLAMPWMVATSYVSVDLFFRKPRYFTVSMLSDPNVA